MINAYYEELDVPFFCLDDVKSSYLATRELISKGHKEIGIIAKMDDLQGKFRMKGFVQALSEAKLTFRPEHVLTFDTSTKPELSRSLENFLSLHRHAFTALVCYNDEVGLEVVNVCRKLGIAIPEELSIVGQDNSYIAQNANINSQRSPIRRSSWDATPPTGSSNVCKGRRTSLYTTIINRNSSKEKRSKQLSHERATDRSSLTILRDFLREYELICKHRCDDIRRASGPRHRDPHTAP